jgi:peptidoglycan-associated lipoprotein
MKRNALINATALGAAAMLLAVGCKTQKPVGLTTIPGQKTIVASNPNPLPVPTPLGGGGIPGGETIPGGGQPFVNPNPIIQPLNPNNGALLNEQGNGFTGQEMEDREAFAALTVHFEYDSAAVHPDDFEKIKLVALHLIQNPTHKLMVEGHCDERGTEDYNLSLGERRALAVVDELSRMNVGAGRLRTLSQGEKVPMLLGLDEQSFSENRRGEFVLLTPAQ